MDEDTESAEVMVSCREFQSAMVDGGERLPKINVPTTGDKWPFLGKISSNRFMGHGKIH